MNGYINLFLRTRKWLRTTEDTQGAFGVRSHSCAAPDDFGDIIFGSAQQCTKIPATRGI